MKELITDFISEMNINKGLSFKKIAELLPDFYPNFEVKEYSENCITLRNKIKKINLKIEKHL